MKVQEVVSLDDEMLGLLQYASCLIFLKKKKTKNTRLMHAIILLILTHMPITDF